MKFISRGSAVQEIHHAEVRGQAIHQRDHQGARLAANGRKSRTGLKGDGLYTRKTRDDHTRSFVKEGDCSLHKRPNSCPLSGRGTD